VGCDEQVYAEAACSPLCLFHVQRIRQCGQECCRVGNVRQQDEGDTIFEFELQQAAKLGEDAGLADPPGPVIVTNGRSPRRL
jgi:hypothetical protein